MNTTDSSTSTLIDVQARPPSVALSLSRLGVTGVEKVIRLRHNGFEQLFSAQFECVVELGPNQKGAPKSRFEEVVNESIAEVSVEARCPEHKAAPVSGVTTQEIYTLHGIAVATELGTRRLTGVTAQGMTACPCAQELIAGSARERLENEGLDAGEIERILEAVPVATHNQRGLGTLYVGRAEGCDDEIDAATLLAIVEQSMSSEIYELMKRSDEAHVVEKAHRRPRFVEDCVREMVRGVADGLPGLGDSAFVSARRVNLETIHQHNVVAERFGTLAEIRAELATDTAPTTHTSLQTWLVGAP